MQQTLANKPVFGKRRSSLKRKKYSIADCLDAGDLDVLKDRFERADEMDDGFLQKMDFIDFSIALSDIRSKCCFTEL